MAETTIDQKRGLTVTLAQAFKIGGTLVTLIFMAAGAYFTIGKTIEANAAGVKQNTERTDSLRSFVIAQNALQDQEIEDLSESVDENEGRIEQIDRLLIRRDGDLANQIQRLDIQQQNIVKAIEDLADAVREDRQ